MELNSKSFCIYPWIHQFANPAGKSGLCCVAQPDSLIREKGKPIDLENQGLAPAWNADGMKEIRAKMLRGEKISFCKTCDFQESIQKKSYRQIVNEEWLERLGKEEFDRRVFDSVKNDFVVSEKPRYLDLRLGNLCNLKCRMCNPYNSVMIHREWTSLDESTGGEYSRFWAKHGYDNGSISPWYESDIFWESCKAIIPGLKKIYLTGGEPTLIQKNNEFLKECVHQGKAKDIFLAFNVNGTRMTDEFIDLIGQFQWTNLVFSIDAVGPLAEYIRYPSQWPQVESNFKKILKAGKANISVGVSPVVQTYNLLNLVELFRWVENMEYEFHQEISVEVLFCENPTFLSIENLPHKIKQEAILRLQEFKKTSPSFRRQRALLKKDFLINGVESIITNLKNSLKMYNPESLKEFFHYTHTLDQKRGQRLEDFCPELWSLLHEPRSGVEVEV